MEPSPTNSPDRTIPPTNWGSRGRNGFLKIITSPECFACCMSSWHISHLHRAFLGTLSCHVVLVSLVASITLSLTDLVPTHVRIFVAISALSPRPSWYLTRRVPFVSSVPHHKSALTRQLVRTPVPGKLETPIDKLCISPPPLLVNSAPFHHCPMPPRNRCSV